MLLRHAPELGRQGKASKNGLSLSLLPETTAEFRPSSVAAFFYVGRGLLILQAVVVLRAKDTLGAQRTGEMRRLTRADSPRLRDDRRKKREQLDKSSPENIMTLALHHVIFISIPEELELLPCRMQYQFPRNCG